MALLSRLKPILFLVVVAVAALIILVTAPTSTLVNVGDQAPELSVKGSDGKEVFVVKDLEGKPLKLSDYRGNVVFLNFWSITCLPCRTEMPDMELINRVFKNRRFKMIPISVDTEFDGVNQFYAEFGLTTMPSYLDPGRRAASRYNVFEFPETYVIDGDGVVLKHYVGGRAWSTMTYMNEIDGWVRKQETDPHSTSR